MTRFEMPPDHILEELASSDPEALALAVNELRNALSEICADIVSNGVSAEKVQLTRMLETALLDTSRALDAARQTQKARTRAMSWARSRAS